MSGSTRDDDVTRVIGEGESTLGAAPDRPRPIVAPGGSIGRYFVIEELGRGGMGVVLRAYDPKLQREVALKVVRATSSDAEARMVREARAMAQINHPNVVAIYDTTVDTIPDPADGVPRKQVVLAMEYVAGATLRQWLKDGRRTREEIVDALLQAGRGLMAAHHGGLLHRDFKPDNVLVGDDGRIRVTDFGLVRPEHDRAPSSAPASAPEEAVVSDHDELTQMGTVLGTPRYMAPEQHRALPLSAAADQYAFCITAWEALNGAPPFTNLQELVQAKLAGAPPWPRSSGVPTRVAEAIRRGLSSDPDDRFASMDGLLAALGRPPSQVWRARNLVFVAGAVVGTVLWVSTTREPICAGAEEQLAGIWDAARRNSIAAGFAPERSSYAPAVWERIAPALDAWARQWQAMYTESCEATRVRRTQSEAMMDLRLACLHRARAKLDAVAQVLTDASPTVIEHAHEVVNGLPPLRQCADLDALRADVPLPDPSQAEAVDAIRDDLAESEARRRAGDYDAALVAATRADEASIGMGYEPLRTDVRVELGAVYNALGRYEDAEVALREGLRLGTQQGQWDAVRTAARLLVRVLGYEMARHAESLALRELVLGLSADEPEAEARGREAIALVLGRMGKHDEAEAEHRSILELRRSVLGPEHPDLALSRNNLGNELYAQGRYDEAETEYRASLEVRERALGPAHPEVAASHNNLGLVLQAQGKYEEAAAEHELALELRTGALGASHPSIAASHNNLGMVLQLQGKLDEAEARYRAAMAIWSDTIGADHPNIARVRANLGTILSSQGRHDEAELEYRAALAVQIERLGAEHPDLTSIRHNLAITLSGQGRLDDAEAEFRAVVEHRTAAFGAEHPEVASSRGGLANVLLDQGKLEEAEAEHRAALTLLTRALGTDHPAVATAHQNLGVVLERRGRNDQAEAQHRAALEARIRSLGDEHPEVAAALLSLGSVLIRSGRRSEGLPLLERAWSIEERGEHPSPQRARAAFELAQALWSDRSERKRALTLAEEAARAYGTLDDLDGRTEVTAWLRAHP